MKFKFAALLLCGMTAAAPAAIAQSGSDTGAGKQSGSTTNSGTARPDTTTSGAGGRTEGALDRASPATSSTGATGERGQRPDAKPANGPNAKATSGSKRAMPTQTDD